MAGFRLWLCQTVAGVRLWLCQTMAVSYCGCVRLWLAVSDCGCVRLWLAVSDCGCVETGGEYRRFTAVSPGKASLGGCSCPPSRCTGNSNFGRLVWQYSTYQHGCCSVAVHFIPVHLTLTAQRFTNSYQYILP